MRALSTLVKSRILSRFTGLLNPDTIKEANLKQIYRTAKASLCFHSICTEVEGWWLLIWERWEKCCLYNSNSFVIGASASLWLVQINTWKLIYKNWTVSSPCGCQVRDSHSCLGRDLVRGLDNESCLTDSCHISGEKMTRLKLWKPSCGLAMFITANWSPGRLRTLIMRTDPLSLILGTLRCAFLPSKRQLHLECWGQGRGPMAERPLHSCQSIWRIVAAQ